MINIEPLKILLSYNNINKEDVILYYMNKNDKKKIMKYTFDEDNLFINSQISGIRKSTLKLEFLGKLIIINENKLTIKKDNSRNITINKNDYYIFTKKKKKDFMKNLLEIL